MEQYQNPVRELGFSLYDICHCTHRKRDHVGGVKQCVIACNCEKYQLNLRVDSIPPELREPPPPQSKYVLTLNRELFQWFVEIYRFQNLPDTPTAIHYLKQELRRTWGIVDYHEFEIRIHNNIHKYQPYHQGYMAECTHCGCTVNHPNHLT